MGKSAKKYIVSEDDQELDFDFLVKEWGSPFVKRSEVVKFSGGLLNDTPS